MSSIRKTFLQYASLVLILSSGIALHPALFLATASAAPAGTGEAASGMSVTLTEVLTQSWPQTVAANGLLAPWQEAIISSETGSLRITDIFVDVGSQVKKGQELARLSRESLLVDQQKQQASLAQAQAALRQASANAARARSIKDSGAISDEKFTDYQIGETTAQAAVSSAQAELASTELKLKQTAIVAVDDGVISSRSAVLGNVVSPGNELFRMLRQGRIEWQAEVDAQQLRQIQTGQNAQISLPGGDRVSGKVRLVAPTLSSSTGRALVYVSLDNPGMARSGMHVSGQIELAAKPALTVPESALVLRDGYQYLFSLNADQTVSRHLVETGRRREGRVEILSGVEAHSRVVDAGAAFLSDGMRVKVVDAIAGGTGQ